MNAEKTNEAAKNLAKLAQEGSKALTDTAITAQERNLAFAQSVLENGIEVLKSHAESTRTIMQELVEQAKKTASRTGRSAGSDGQRGCRSGAQHTVCPECF